jgi:hypothetical protein
LRDGLLKQDFRGAQPPITHSIFARTTQSACAGT